MACIISRTCLPLLPRPAPALRRHCWSRSSAVARSRLRNFSGALDTRQPHFHINPEVAGAIGNGHPVVALETTILTHGMPYPHNIETAQEVERLIRSEGAVPATIGVLDGVVRVGLTQVELERLANRSNDDTVFKTSRRDLAYVLSKGLSGGTTVAATMLCAHKAGIPVFVTGGVGGVHRGGEATLDVSADLSELGRTPVAVLCAGVKSILDIGRTLEVLETQGVTVVTYGSTNEFPAFFTPTSGFKAPYNVETPLECAKLIDANLTFGTGSGLLVGVPIPSTSAGLGSKVEAATELALEEASQAGITGRDVTPFVLERVSQLTVGESLQANVELICNNATVGGRVSVELARLKREGSGPEARSRVVSSGQQGRRKGRTVGGGGGRGGVAKRPVVVGASVLDFVAKIRSPDIALEGTNPGSLQQSCGGVGRNVAECLSCLGLPPLLLSAVGEDVNGCLLTDHLAKCGMPLDGVFRSSSLPTATYCVVLDSRGETFCAIGDMDVNGCISTEWVSNFSEELRQASIVCLDGNIGEECIQYVCDCCSAAGVPVWFEPTCVNKAVRPLQAGSLDQLSCATPNIVELQIMHSALTGKEVPLPGPGPTTALSTEEKLERCRALAPALLRHVPLLLVSLGEGGVLAARREEGGGVVYDHYQPAASHLLPVSVISVSGSGDSFTGAAIAGFALGYSPDLAIKAGLRAAYLSVQSSCCIAHNVSPELFSEESIANWAPWTPSRFFGTL